MRIIQRSRKKKRSISLWLLILIDRIQERSGVYVLRRDLEKRKQVNIMSEQQARARLFQSFQVARHRHLSDFTAGCVWLLIISIQ